METMPKWADLILIPLINLLLAFVISGLVILAIGEDPIAALNLMVQGALGSTYGWGFTLYYATNFIFTGLAVAVAFHASLFNIGGEGQAALGGLGVALVCLMVPWPHWSIALLAAIAGSALFGALWATIPAYLQAKRGSHIVITTIMFNFIAASLLNYLLVNILRPKGSMDPASGRFPEATHLPTLSEILNSVGIPFAARTPVNISLFVALIACVLVYLLIWRTRLGYQIRAFGKSEPAAVYAGISPVRIIMITMMISGALAGLMAINNVMGEAERLVLNSVEGAGFIGIAVALMGRSHPFGVLIAALLFGFLYQGGAELALWTSIPRELIVVIQA
ncbi:MAG: ABC transporter permease, partial [Litoreibacter sp.]|nr:ABC transporter permease [Litoreibacter sp.]